jgi:hypothetical protein
MRYQVQGTITRNRHGWDSTRQIPTFYLDGRVQGILSVEHARDVARDIVDTIAGPSTPGETVTTALHVEPVEEPAEAGLSAQARRWIRTRKAGHITDGELAISLASLLGVDARCELGECPHDDGSHSLPADRAVWPL